MILLPLGKTFVQDLLFHCESASINTDKISIYVDIQNLFLSKYDPKFSENFFVNDYTPVQVIEDILYWVSIKHNELYHSGFKDIKFVFYTDTGRNIFNQNFIPTWKEDRKKSYVQLKESSPAQYQYVSFASQVFDTVIDILKKFINNSTVVRLIDLKYIDSDFVPALFYLKDPNRLHILVTTDHDYYHLLQENKTIIRYNHIYKIRQTYGTFEDMFNAHVRIKKKYGLKEDEALLVAKYYQIFHALIGDASDNVKSLVKGKGIKYWVKKLKPILEEFNTNKIRLSVVFDECFIPELEEINSEHTYLSNKWQEFRARMFMFDFILTSNIFLDDLIKQKFITSFPIQKNIVDDISQEIDTFLSPNTKYSIQDAKYILESIRIHPSKSDYISQSLFY